MAQGLAHFLGAGRRGGFTLLELVLVLAIIAIALAAVSPTLSGFVRGRRTEETAARFVALTHWARSAAISDGVGYRVAIDTHGGKWWVSVEDGDGFAGVSGTYGQVYTAPEGVTVDTDAPVVDGVSVVGFDASGRSDVAVVRFIGDGGDVVEVECNSPVDVFHVVKEGGRR